MNEDGRVLQDSRGRPRKVVLGEDGKTIFGMFFYSFCFWLIAKNKVKDCDTVNIPFMFY